MSILHIVVRSGVHLDGSLSVWSETNVQLNT